MTFLRSRRRTPPAGRSRDDGGLPDGRSIDAIMLHLANHFPFLCERRELPHGTEGGRSVYALKIASGGGSGRRAFLAVGGMHAREYMNPDAIIELAGDLVRAYLLGQGITYKGSTGTQGRTWTAQDVRLMVETLDIWFIPTANPDGRDYAMDHDDMWRMNRHDNDNSPCFGVDVNRNFDIAWATTTSATSCTVCDPNQVYCGLAPSPSRKLATSGPSWRRSTSTSSWTCTLSRSGSCIRGATRPSRRRSRPRTSRPSPPEAAPG